MNRKEDRKQRIIRSKRRKIKVNCYLCVFLLLQVTVALTAGRDEKRRRS
jgi:hypothetical protein